MGKKIALVYLGLFLTFALLVFCVFNIDGLSLNQCLLILFTIGMCVLVSVVSFNILENCFIPDDEDEEYYEGEDDDDL